VPPIRIVAIPTEVAESVRATLKAPVYGFPAHAELATDPASCRHCLGIMAPGMIVFRALNRCPSPVPFTFMQTHARCAENAGFPEELRGSPRALEAYARGRRLVAQEYVADGKYEPAIEKLFSLSDVDYLQVNSATAGCFTFRIDRIDRGDG
jgi:hypothetical protein